VHTLLDSSSILLVVIGSSLTLFLLRYIQDWSQRRMVQFIILSMPLMTLGLGLGSIHHFIGSLCFSGVPFWDVLLGILPPLIIIMIAFGAFCLAGIRLLLMKRVIARAGGYASEELQKATDTLRERINAPQTRVFLCHYNRPLAFTAGLSKPVILLSTWMLEQFDERELEAVLTHELEHVVQHDYLMNVLAMFLRDAFFYLPTSRIVYRKFQREKELMCDEQVVRITHRPLALASALTKVWLHTANESQFFRWSGAQHLVEAEPSINHRIERLLEARRCSKPCSRHARTITTSMSVSAFITWLIVVGANLLIILALIGCNPVA
jgi:beta-lactamase regulating signal transducer with metallopeptidase domain